MKYNICYDHKHEDGTRLWIVKASEQEGQLTVTLPVNLLDAEFYVASIIGDDDEVCEDDVCFTGAEFKADVLLTKEFLGMTS